jgi:hypothetical protein
LRRTAYGKIIVTEWKRATHVRPRQAIRHMRIARLYCDHAGESHFDDIEIDLFTTNFVSSASLIELSSPTPASQARFMSVRAGWRSDWHTSSARAMFFVLTGEWEVSTSDGESRRFGVGSALLVEDVSGKGHASRVLGDEGSVAAMIELA